MADEQTGTPFTHPLTEKLHPDPDRFGGRATVVGYPGPSPQAGRVRVYLDTTFTSYYELDAAAVLDTAPAKANDENSPTVVVIESSTPVDVVRVESGQTQARYLEGSITRGYLPPAAAARAAGAAEQQARCGGSCAAFSFAAEQQAPCGGSCAAFSFAAEQQAPCGGSCAAFSFAAEQQARCGGSCAAFSFAAEQQAPCGGSCAAFSFAAEQQAPCGGSCAAFSFAAEQQARCGGTLGPITFAQQARAPQCCNPTYTAANCTRGGPTMAGAVPAWQGNDCLQVAGTTLCTVQTGVPHLCG
jgi:hypothetical protein